MTSPNLPYASFLCPALSELRSYLPFPGHFPIRLDANEAPPLLSESARGRLAEAAAKATFERYPDATMTPLREALGSRHGVDPSQILVGAGSDELIALLLSTLNQPRKSGTRPVVLTVTPTFVMYRMSAKIRGWQTMEVPLDATWDLDESGLHKALETVSPNLLFIASPNNPSGNLMSPKRLVSIIERAHPAIVVVDEAYVNYAATDQLSLLKQFDNVLIFRTMSKIGFAALRVGWMMGPEGLIAELDKARQPYNVPTLSQTLATLALTELWPDVCRVVTAVTTERQRLLSTLSNLPRVSVTPSDSNMLWVKTERAAKEVFEGLCERGILIRSFHEKGGRLGHQLRVTVGTAAENDAFLAALGQLA
jgi:histidinol-phosphate aminotransferase